MAEIIRRQTEKKYGELREGETMSGKLFFPDTHQC